MRLAITKGVSPAIGNCELTFMKRAPIDIDAARAQHRSYERALEDLGCRITRLDEDEEFPDSVFVEDIAVVLDEVAIITRPGAPSRRGEREAIESTLSPHRMVERIEAPGILDGGDVLVVGRSIYVGLSSRSNAEAASQLRIIVGRHGYSVFEVGVEGCLHLKSAATALSESSLLINPDWVDTDSFPGLDFVHVDPSEPEAANVIRLGDTVLFAAAFPRTGARLTSLGFDARPVDASELAKAEGALTCCSLIFVIS